MFAELIVLAVLLDAGSSMVAKQDKPKLLLNDQENRIIATLEGSIVRKLKNEIQELKDRLDSYSSYCNINGGKQQCGQCLCKDDRRLTRQYYCDCTNLPPKKDCLDFYQQGHGIDGVYTISTLGRKFQVYCDQTTDGGGWTVFQRRNGDPSVNFYRTWAEYKTGFGDLQHEYWLGNDNLFRLSLGALCESGSTLRVDMESTQGSRTFAKYENFQVGNEFTKYLLNVGGYSGNASDYLSYHNNMKFSTYDRDNDEQSGSCAQIYKSGWWYYNCNSAHLNGRYLLLGDSSTANTGAGVYWNDQKKFSEMKMRRKSNCIGKLTKKMN